MGLIRYLAPALAVAVGAAAQCSTSGTTTIQSQADATALASCSTFQGSIAIGSDTSDPISFQFSKITQDLVINNVTQLSSLMMDQLTEIGGTWTMNGVTVLSTLSANSLTQVGAIDWTAVPALQQLTFGDAGVTVCPNISIINTQLTTLAGINPSTVDTITISNNPYLTTLDMTMSNVTTALTFAYNGANLNASLPNLEFAFNISIRALSGVSLPMLTSTNKSLGFFESDLADLELLNLTSVGGDFVIQNNNDLTSVSVPLLATINGGLDIANNTKFENVTMPDLKTVGGAMNIMGSLSTISFPALNLVKGAATWTSSEDITKICDNFNSVIGPKYIRGKPLCQSGEASASPSSNGSATSSTKSTKPTGAANGVLAPLPITGVIGLIVAVFGLL